MAHSVESRVPYLDYRLVEFAINVPTEQKIHGTLTKIILREAMKKYLPSEIYNRKDKIGFEAPVEKNIFFDEKFYKQCLDLISKTLSNRYDFIDLNKVNRTNIFGLYTLSRFIEIWQ